MSHLDEWICSLVSNTAQSLLSRSRLASNPYPLTIGSWSEVWLKFILPSCGNHYNPARQGFPVMSLYVWTIVAGLTKSFSNSIR